MRVELCQLEDMASLAAAQVQDAGLLCVVVGDGLQDRVDHLITFQEADLFKSDGGVLDHVAVRLKVEVVAENALPPCLLDHCLWILNTAVTDSLWESFWNEAGRTAEHIFVREKSDRVDKVLRLIISRRRHAESMWCVVCCVCCVLLVFALLFCCCCQKDQEEKKEKQKVREDIVFLMLRPVSPLLCFLVSSFSANMRKCRGLRGPMVGWLVV